MEYMFYKCKNLNYINNLLTFETKNVSNMCYMFSYCYNLKYLYLFLFNFNNVETINNIFDYCYTLKDLKMFLNTKNIINIEHVFEIYHKLKIISNEVTNNEYFNKYTNEIDILLKLRKMIFIGKFIF